VKKPALYFTVLGEPAMKMLRYQQQFSFFDESKLGKAIRFFNLAEDRPVSFASATGPAMRMSTLAPYVGRAAPKGNCASAPICVDG
jgi:N-acetylglucosamine kinase-like BadF-type ATPase